MFRRKRNLLKLSILAALLVSVPTVFAATNTDAHYVSVRTGSDGSGSNFDNDMAKAIDSMVVGVDSTVEHKAKKGVVVGHDSTLGNELDGSNSDNNSIVVGNELKVNGQNNTVFGTTYENNGFEKTHVQGNRSTVVGVGNRLGYIYSKENGGTYTPSNPVGMHNDENTVVGITNEVVSNGSVILGNNNKIHGDGNPTISLVAGTGNKVTGKQRAVVLGHLSKTSGEESIVIGTRSEGSNSFSITVGSDATNSGRSSVAIGESSRVSGDSSVAIGKSSRVSGDYSVAIGESSNSSDNVSVAIGSEASATSVGGIALGYTSVADVEGDIKGYNPNESNSPDVSGEAWESTYGAVSIGKDGVTRQIIHVAAGLEDTDAVNVAQLKSLDKKMTDILSGNTNVNNDIKTINNRIDTVNNTLNNRIDTVNNTLNNRIDKVSDRLDKSGASLAALAGLHPLDFDPDNKLDFTASYGHYSGKDAFALGAYYRPNEMTMFSVGTTLGNSENMFNLGVSFKVGKGNTNMNLTKVQMAEKLTVQEQEIIELKERSERLQEQVNMLIQQINASK